MLLESTLPSLQQCRSLLFSQPLRLLRAELASELPAFLEQVQRAVGDGYYLAGYLTYEAGALLHGLPAHPLPPAGSLASLGVYGPPRVFHHLSPVTDELSEPATSTARLPLALMPTLSREDYLHSLAQIQERIAAGETYQVNYTTRLRSQISASTLDIYERLQLEQLSSYTALVRLDCGRTILSFSPELFFQTTPDRQIVTRPMKGTAARDPLAGQDRAAARALQQDEKNRAEHVMIVDLLRNDLGRICETGSVQVNDLFHVESYPTVHQMVSTVRGRLRPDVRWGEIFTSLFPSGSITGAPKRRTMQIVRELEPTTRDVYTGAIGYIAPSGEAAFSVAIRTLCVEEKQGGSRVTMGVGGGIVADSVPASEWQECLLKTAFVHRASCHLSLIETMLIPAGAAVPARWPLHRNRLRQTAADLGFPHDDDHITAAVLAHASHDTTPARRLRLTLSREGEIAVAVEELKRWPTFLRIRMSAVCTQRDDSALRYKTSFRHTYDEALRQALSDGFDECLFRNGRGQLTEGCITNLVLRREGRMLTPALHCGVLPGVYRQSLLEAGELSETVLTVDELHTAEAVYLCNSVRGLVPVHSIQLVSGEILLYPR